MMMMPLGVVVVVGLLLFSSSCSVVESLRFDLKSNIPRCIAQDMKRNSMTVGNYTIVNPNDGQPLPDSHTITVRVVSHGTNVQHLAENVQAGQFSFIADDSGDYVACFWGKKDIDPPITLSIDFEWKTGVIAKFWPSVAKKRQLDGAQIELQIMHGTVLTIQSEMTYLRERNQEMHELNDETNTRMFWLSFASFFICFSVAGLQLWHLKTFFVKNKLI